MQCRRIPGLSLIMIQSLAMSSKSGKSRPHRRSNMTPGNIGIKGRAIITAPPPPMPTGFQPLVVCPKHEMLKPAPLTSPTLPGSPMSRATSPSFAYRDAP